MIAFSIFWRSVINSEAKKAPTRVPTRVRVARAVKTAAASGNHYAKKYGGGRLAQLFTVYRNSMNLLMDSFLDTMC